MKVQCPSCKKVCYQTTPSFDADTMPNGGMVTLLRPWSSYGWGKFGGGGNSGSSVMASDMLCVVCEAALAPAGRLTVVPDDHQEVPKPPTLEQKNQEAINSMIDEPEDELGEDEYLGEDSLPQEEVEAESTAQAGEPSSEPTPPSPFICDQCGWTGKTDAALKRHKTIKRHN